VKPSEVIAAARDKIGSPDKWTQGAYARTSDGTKLDWEEVTKGVCWCLVGATTLCDPWAGGRAADNYIRSAASSFNRRPGEAPSTHDFLLDLEEWNDAPERTHHEVLTVLSRAHSLALKDGQ